MTDRDNPDSAEQIDLLEGSSPDRPGSHRPSKRAFIIGGAAATLLAVGGGAVAMAAAPSSSAPTGSASASSSTGAKPTDSTTRPVHKPHLGGTVKSVSGSTILVTDRDGFTRTIKTSSATTYNDSLTASPAVGTVINAEGTVDADGTSLDATVIGKGALGGPGGGRGPGGGHGPGPGGTKPTGVPTGAPTSVPTGTKTTPTPSATAS
ncbi:MAG: hypothetical protein JWM76_1988 [Pseudonocardiales bacterium]|nr:hypothetical protein [Pseudonocardiales bacterium]